MRGDGSIAYDHRRKNWRVAVIVNGERIHRRALTYAEANGIREELIGLRERGNLWRVRVEHQRALLDLSGLNDAQVNAILALIETFTTDEDTE